MRFFEDRTNPIIRPTNNQMKVLTIIKASPTPEVAAAEISTGSNLLAARDMLVKLGLISIEDNQARVTDKGEEIMKNQNLVDETGNLTPEGEKYAYDGSAKKEQPQPQTEGLLRSINAAL